MIKYLLSLVIPYYRNRDSIDIALTSLEFALQQCDSMLIEVVFVNNNSDDGTEEKVKNFQHEKCHVVHAVEINQGVSNARNCGIHASSSNYIAFLDADDALDLCYFSDVAQGIKLNPDIIFVNHENFSAVQSYERCVASDLLKNHIRRWWNWQFVFKRCLSVNLKFEGACFEDFGFFPVVLARSRDCLVLRRGLYQYKENSASLTKRSVEWQILELQGQFDRLCLLFDELGDGIFNRVQRDFYEHIALLRAISGHFPVLSLNNSIQLMLLSCSWRERFECTKKLLKLNVSTVYRPIKGLIVSASK
jgi:glycosyltransferase involved in cell wall biosynthesis